MEQLQCRHCTGMLRRSNARRRWNGLMRLLGYKAFRCRKCSKRTYRYFKGSTLPEEI